MEEIQDMEVIKEEEDSFLSVVDSKDMVVNKVLETSSEDNKVEVVVLLMVSD